MSSAHFHEGLLGVEGRAREETDARLAGNKLGERAPRCWEAVWGAVEVLYDYATCTSHCPGEGDHTFRLIAGRAVNLAFGALASLRAAHYESCLLIARGLGELGNVTGALTYSARALDDFKDGRRLRGKEFAILRAAGVQPIVSGRRYGLLSERAVHPSFDDIVKSHVPGRVIVGPLFQDAGFLLCVNELAIAIGSFIFLCRDESMAASEVEAIKSSLLTVGESIGSLLVDNLPDGLVHLHPQDRWRGVQ